MHLNSHPDTTWPDAIDLSGPFKAGSTAGGESGLKKIRSLTECNRATLPATSSGKRGCKVARIK